jgi:TPR repeat protein
MHLNGEGVPVDHREAIRLFRLSSDHSAALVSIGYCYEYGLGVERSQSEAIRLYWTAALRNEPYAFNVLSILFEGWFTCICSMRLLEFSRCRGRWCTERQNSSWCVLPSCYSGEAQTRRKQFSCSSFESSIAPRSFQFTHALQNDLCIVDCLIPLPSTNYESFAKEQIDESLKYLYTNQIEMVPVVVLSLCTKLSVLFSLKTSSDELPRKYASLCKACG